MLAAINAGHSEAWSCWMTRRLVLALLERAEKFVANTSPLAQRASVDHRSDVVAFEHDAAIARTAKAMSRTPPAVLKMSATSAELAKRLTISSEGERFRFELHGESGGSAAGMLTRAELQRILQMLQSEVTRVGWSAPPTNSPAAPASGETGSKTFRH